MMKKKIAIACQGGGSQTAFTAGVLKSFFQNGVHEKHEIVSLSGTSGGAVCATLSWYGLLRAARGDPNPVEQRLEAFWRANSTQNLMEVLLNDSMVRYTRWVGEGVIPEWKSGPNSPLTQALLSTSRAVFPRFCGFEDLLGHYINFDELDELITSSSPVLLLGAANVLSGEFKKFSSRKNEISLEAVLASAAVPSIFPAVKVEAEYYWDGLFSDNPPTDELIQTAYVGADRKPEQLWVIQINPKQCQEIPTRPEEIADRRNEMIGNESLFQDLVHIDMVNRFLKRGAFKEEYIKEHSLKEIDIFTIQMSEDLQKTLDYASKLDRDASFIDRLIRHGESRGNLFLRKPEAMRYPSGRD